MTIKAAIEQLRNYKDSAELSLHPGASDAMLQAVENTYNITLPDDFKEFYRFSDGFETVEDIFNMIPFKNIIEDKNQGGKAAFDIAEYMIYSDMWQMEINPDNCNNYKIFIEANNNKLVLTNSLGEFISHFLEGGVFGIGGLYEWQEEVELQPIYTTKLKTAEFLLTVFYFGVRYGLVSTTEVKDWADGIIIHEDEPEYFFIELTLSHDKNEMLSLLNTVCLPENNVTARAILGLLYHRLSADVITANEAIAIMDKFDFIKSLPETETNCIYGFTDETWMNDPIVDDDGLTENLLNFLAHYKTLEIANYKHWLSLSLHIEYKFKQKEDELNSINQQVLHDPNFRLGGQRVLILVTTCTLAIVSLLIVITTHTNIAGELQLSKFQADLYLLSALYLTGFILYFFLKATLWVLLKLLKVVK